MLAFAAIFSVVYSPFGFGINGAKNSLFDQRATARLRLPFFHCVRQPVKASKSVSTIFDETAGE